MKFVIDPGTVAEYKFAARCLEHNWLVSWPSSKVVSYDCLVDNGNKILRCQIKGTFVKAKGSDRYDVNIRKGGSTKNYTRDEIDMIAAYVSHTDTWYILPIEVVEGKGTISVYPHRPDEKVGMYEQFKEAWHLLK